MDENLVGYLLGALDPEAHREVEARLETDPEARLRLEALRRCLEPLEADRDEVEPPADLAVRTVATVAEYVANNEPRTPEPDDSPCADFIRACLARLEAEAAAPSEDAPVPARARPSLNGFAPLPSSDHGEIGPVRARRWDVIVTAALLAAVLCVVLPALNAARQQRYTQQCQNNMRVLHEALVGYSDLNDGRFPQIQEQPPYNVAGAFAPLLAEAGQLPPDARLACPASQRLRLDDPAVAYAYSLGYRERGELRGLDRRPDNDNAPILADRPGPGIRADGFASAANHRGGQNVLFVGGHVRFCTDAKVGVAGDNIYCNELGEIGAGLHRWDSSLGFDQDRP